MLSLAMRIGSGKTTGPLLGYAKSRKKTGGVVAWLRRWKRWTGREEERISIRAVYIQKEMCRVCKGWYGALCDWNADRRNAMRGKAHNLETGESTGVEAALVVGLGETHQPRRVLPLRVVRLMQLQSSRKT